MTYYVTVIRGLEEIAEGEILAKLPGTAPRHDQPVGPWGRVSFDFGGPVQQVLALRSIENVFAAVDEFDGVPTNGTGLEVIRAGLAETDLAGALEAHAQVHGPKASPTFRCTSKRDGDQLFSSTDIMAAAGAGVVERYGWKVDLEGHDYDIHVDLAGDRCTVGLRLTPFGLHHRSRIVHSPASINPSLAYAMCLLTEPQEGETFLDPMCGAGTVLIERAAVGPARLLAGDLHRHPMDLARRNFEAHHAPVGLCRWDARRLPLPPESVSKIVCNLPWGRRTGSHLSNRHLYPGFSREMARVLRVGGIAVLLTLERAMLTRVVERHGWLRIEREMLLTVGGLNPWLFVVRKYRSHERPDSD